MRQSCRPETSQGVALNLRWRSSEDAGRVMRVNSGVSSTEPTRLLRESGSRGLASSSGAIGRGADAEAGRRSIDESRASREKRGEVSAEGALAEEKACGILKYYNAQLSAA